MTEPGSKFARNIARTIAIPVLNILAPNFIEPFLFVVEESL
ncbi:hypothetical protein HB162lentus_27270 [Mammaliicoccus lentus]